MLEELVSDWEVDEIREELRSGVAPDIVAFRHSVPSSAVREYSKRRAKGHERYLRRFEDRWTDAEKAFVRDNYPNHGRWWDGWKMLDRTWDAIRWRAHLLGVRKRVKGVNEGWRKSNGALVRPRKERP